MVSLDRKGSRELLPGEENPPYGILEWAMETLASLEVRSEPLSYSTGRMATL